jgi:hypothetical protein
LWSRVIEIVHIHNLRGDQITGARIREAKMNRTSLPVAGGIICIVVGSLSLVGSLFLTLIVSIMTTSAYWDGPMSSSYAGAFVWVLFIPYFVICVLAITGGVFALRRKTWGLALTGAICSLLTWWGWIFGVAAIVLIAVSKKEFIQVNTAESVTVIPPPLH